MLDQAFRIYRIVAAMNNKFGCRIISDIGRTEEVIQLFRDNLHRPNNLKSIVEDLSLVRRSSQFSRLDSLESLPYLSLGQLGRIAGGSYQVSEAVNYYFDTVNRYGQLSFFVCNTDVDYEDHNIYVQELLLVKSRVGSRYSRAGSYFVFVLIDKAKEGRESICEYFCQCLVGSRTLGCCCHVMAVIWFITWARSTDRIRGPAEWLRDFAVRCESED